MKRVAVCGRLVENFKHPVKVFIQRIADGLFLKAEAVWVSAKEEAQTFSNCTPAIDLCVERGITNVRLWVAFEDPKYDFPMEVFRVETKTLVQYNKELREKRARAFGRITRRAGGTKRAEKTICLQS